MAKRDRSASLTQLLTEATSDGPPATPEPERTPAAEPVSEPEKKAPQTKATKKTSKKPTTKTAATTAPKPGRGEARATSSSSKRTASSKSGSKAQQAGRAETAGEGHVRYSDGSYLRADGERRVALQLKMRPDDKQALKVQAAAAGLSPAEYVAGLVQRDAG